MENRHIYGVGIDTASIDYGQSKSFLTHRTLAKHNIFFIENVNTKGLDIEDLPQGPVLVINPLKITSGSGSPVRPILVFGLQIPNTVQALEAQAIKTEAKTDL